MYPPVATFIEMKPSGSFLENGIRGSTVSVWRFGETASQKEGTLDFLIGHFRPKRFKWRTELEAFLVK